MVLVDTFIGKNMSPPNLRHMTLCIHIRVLVLYTVLMNEAYYICSTQHRNHYGESMRYTI